MIEVSSGKENKTERFFDLKKIKTIFRVAIILTCLIFIVAWVGSFYAIRQHNETVRLIAENPSEISGVVIKDPNVNGNISKTNYEFEFGGKKYSGEASENYDLPIGEVVCINFNKDNPWKNVYCVENIITEMNYTFFAIKVAFAFITLLLFGFLWKFISGDKRFIVEEGKGAIQKMKDEKQ